MKSEVFSLPGAGGWVSAMKSLGRFFWSPVRPSENWAQTLVRVAGNLLRWVIGLPIVAGLIGWGVFSFHSWWSDRPYRLTGLEGVEIGMTPTEVTLIKGAPQLNSFTRKDPLGPANYFDQFDEADPERDPLITKTNEDHYTVNRNTGEVRKRDNLGTFRKIRSAINADGDILINEGAGWVPLPSSAVEKHQESSIEVMRFDDLAVFFDRDSEGSWHVFRICLTAPRYYDKVIGVSGSDTEAQVVRHLGQPDSVSVDDDGLGKRSSFERYNLLVRFEKARVAGICAGA
ncbi:hypothetical protein K1X12_11995 [Hyphomonas sp. WL0036]|uniref:hypothetical protein n=1 Tax=Hyphomonas sediminis TaxID=2866160 RepID=UPI001C82783A|nr:hypothetical protein [Hyphomonas sediminis]MBY9067624.1 hypothetical protein [Hyphomonas sediminis]